MKNIKLNILKFITIIAVIAICAAGGMRTVHAANYGAYIDLMDEKFPDSAGLVSSISDSLRNGGYSQLAQDLINGAGAYNSQVIRVSVDNGYMLEYVDQFKACGKLDANWQPASSSAKTTTETTAPAPQAKTEFTVTDLEPYSAWATQDCNIRSGADTTYDKAGSLKKYEEVTVTGKASTGWFRITTASGIEAYISDSLLTKEDPNKNNAEEDEKTAVTNDTSYEEATKEDSVAEAKESQNNENPTIHEHSYSSEITQKPTCTQNGVATYKCECGDVYTEEIPALEHSEGDWEVTKEPTLFADGERIKKCNICGEILLSETVIHSPLPKIICGVLLLLVGVAIVLMIHKHVNAQK